MRIRTTLFLIFGFVSAVILYIGVLNYFTFETQFAESLQNGATNFEEFYQNFRANSLVIFISTAIIAVGVMIATSYLSKQIVNPIEKLDSSMRNFETEILDNDLKLTSSINEYNELFKNYEKMIRKMQQTIELEKSLVEEYKHTDRQKNEFMAMVSHELKSPLVPIMGYLYLLKNKKIGELNEKQMDAINTIVDSSERLEKLIGDILIAQKLEMGKIVYNRETIPVKEFIEKILKDFRISNPKVHFVNSSKENIEVYSDPARLTQVLTNLIKNAVDFVPEIGIIDVGAFADDKNVVFFVKDNGMGIPEEKQNLLFRKFYQIDTTHRREHAGSGLGLSICKGLVEGLSGRIWVKSQAGKGSTFYFTIPKNHQISDQATKTDLKLPKIQQKG